MESKYIKTDIGRIHYRIQEKNSELAPIIFLHGVYFDSHLWDRIISDIMISKRTLILVDMPMHGKSKDVSKDWTMDDCRDMLVEITEKLGYKKYIGIGHSWGSMILLRAADIRPDLFEKLLLLNMPTGTGSVKTKLKFLLQHTLLLFRNFYKSQVLKAMFERDEPEYERYLDSTFSFMTNNEIKKTDIEVITKARDTKKTVQNLRVPLILARGKSDYIDDIPEIDTILLNGGHVSPLEDVHGVVDLARTL